MIADHLLKPRPLFVRCAVMTAADMIEFGERATAVA
jgi:hypothetical protein